MSKRQSQSERPDVYTFSVWFFHSDELAANIHANMEAIGRRVEDTHEYLSLTGGDGEILPPVLVRVIRVFGKRPGEGLIASDMKRRAKEVDRSLTSPGSLADEPNSTNVPLTPSTDGV